jgi:hypothetical protein
MAESVDRRKTVLITGYSVIPCLLYSLTVGVAARRAASVMHLPCVYINATSEFSQLLGKLKLCPHSLQLASKLSHWKSTMMSPFNHV